MLVEFYSQNRHYETLQGWLKERNLSWDESYIPKTGFVVLEGNLPIAIAFLRLVEGNVALFDGAITNPKASKVSRGDALSLLTEKLLQEAKQRKLLGVMAHTNHRTVKKILSEYGFNTIPNEVIFIKELT